MNDSPAITRTLGKRSLARLVSVRAVFFLALTVICLCVSYERHKDHGIHNYESELYADKAGYYVYLPAATLYAFDPFDFPVGIDEKCGMGFVLNDTTGKVATRYTYGVALMELPFFGIAHVIAGMAGYDQDGFSEPYYRSVNYAAIFYLILGFFFLDKVLRKYFTPGRSLFILALLFFGTNLYWYVIRDSGFSHVYSFFLCSVFLYCVKEMIDGNRGTRMLWIMAFAAALIVLVRPLNILILTALLFWDISSREDLRARAKWVFSWRVITVMAVAGLIVFAPQMLYWYYLTGKLIYYSYEEWATFTNLGDPEVIPVWFAARSGLFLYSPVFIAVMIGVLTAIVKRMMNGWFLLAVFLILTYLCASWFEWGFGCSSGQRNFVEYYPLFAFALGAFITAAAKSSFRILKYSIPVALIVLALAGWRVNHFYWGCYFSHHWDYSEYYTTIKGYTGKHDPAVPTPWRLFRESKKEDIPQ